MFAQPSPHLYGNDGSPVSIQFQSDAPSQAHVDAAHPALSPAHGYTIRSHSPVH
jgi:hypothetical protein